MDGWITIGTKLDNKKLDKDIEAVEKELNDLNRAYDTTRKMKPYEGQKKDLRELEKALDKAEAKLMKLNQKQESINIAQVGNIGTTINSISNSTSDIIKKVGKWALAIFSVRSAYMFITRASSTLAQYNEEYAQKLEYIRYSLAQMLAPVLEYIVNLVLKLLSYINYIANAWFGVNLFSKASAKNFGSMANSAKTIQKSLAGFDEMNVLSDTSSSGGGGGGVSPNMDLSQIQGEVPSWIKWIADNGELLIAILGGIAGGLLAIHFGASLIQGLGIGILIAGVIKLIEDLMDYLNDPSWENFGKIIQDVGIILVGLGILIGNIPLIVAGAIVLIIGTIVKYWEQIKGFFQKGIDWLTSKSDWIHEKFGDTIGNIYDLFVRELGYLLDLVVTIAQVTGNIISSVFKAVVNAVLRTIENVLNSPIRAINGLIGVINAIPGINLNKLSTFNLPRLKTGAIINQPRQRSICWRSNSRRSRCRRNITINR